MAFNSIEVLRKVSRWTDDLKKDTKFFGVGNVSNQIHLVNGTKLEAHSNEDRSFSYELIDNQIYAYGLLDGYNGISAVDLVEQVLLTNLCFDHLHTLQTKSDDDIFAILKTEFEKAEQTLKENLNETLMKRATLAFQNEELRKGTLDYLKNKKEIKACDAQLSSGLFAILALIIDKKLYVANVGIANCFVCLYDKNKNEKKVISLESDHTIFNDEERLRLKNSKADLNEALNNNEINKVIENHNKYITYTRCLGDFRLKFYYNEHPQFKECSTAPVLSDVQHLPKPIVIDDSFLFLVMYSDGLSKVLEAIYSDSGNDENKNSVIAKMLINKIKSEQTLNSATQSVLDEVKRTYDDKFSSSYYEREDLTLIVRVFDENLKKKLISIDNCSSSSNNNSTFNLSTNDTDLNTNDDSSNYDTMIDTNKHSNDFTLTDSINENDDESLDQRESDEQYKWIESHLDTNGDVIPYLNMDEFENLLNLPENKQIIDDILNQLKTLDI